MKDPAERLDAVLELLSKDRADSGSDLELAKKELKSLSDRALLEQVKIPELAKLLFLLDIKHEGRIRLLPLPKEDCCIYIKRKIPLVSFRIANISYFPVEIHFIRIEDGALVIEGNFVTSVPFEGSAAFYVRAGDGFYEQDTIDYGFDSYIGGHKYELKPGFLFRLPLKEESYEISFYQKISGNMCRVGKLNCLRFAPAADVLKDQYCFLCGYIIYIKDGYIFCRKASQKEREGYEQRFQESLLGSGSEDAAWAVGLRREYFKEKEKKERPIWLFMDRPDRADDNGEVFFSYMQGHPEIDTYFVIDEKSPDYQRIEKIGKTVPLYSKEHYLLSLLADFVISSQCNGAVENPFWERCEYFRDLYHRPKLIFLQHGVIKDDMSPTLNRFNTNFTGFITSTGAERQSIIDYPYFYGKDQIWLTGLPVFDELKNDEQKLILIAPTWRKGLMHQQWDMEKREMRWVPDRFINGSEYYMRYRSLLKDKELAAALDQAGYRMVFKPHPLMEPYVDDITRGTHAEFAGAQRSYRELVSRASLLVTDYSSLTFEFAYLNKPTLYYQFDRKSFFADHTYKKGYFDYSKDGFGPVCESKEELKEQLLAFAKGCKKKGDVYEDRIAKLYPAQGESCRILYEKLCALYEEADFSKGTTL